MGVYKIKNIINGKIYIGSSKDINKRWKQHLNLLKKGIHHSYKLQEEWDQFGENCFIFEILQIVDDEKHLKIAEQSWLDKYKPYVHGYNVSDATIEYT